MINENISTDEISMREIWPLLFTRKETDKKNKNHVKIFRLTKAFPS